MRIKGIDLRAELQDIYLLFQRRNSEVREYTLLLRSKLVEIKLGTNFAVFVLFFGLALVEAIQSQNWLEAGIFFMLGVIFLLGDSSKSNNKNI